MSETSDPDFSSLLDAALGIDVEECRQEQHGAAVHSQAQPQSTHLEPTAHALSPPGSPCMSCDSSINWVGCTNARYTASGTLNSYWSDHLQEQAGCYSPVRSDPPDAAGQQGLGWGVEQQMQLQMQDYAAAAHQQQQLPLLAGSITREAAEAAGFPALVCFTALPREVQMRVLCFLSADALTTLAQTCQQLRGLCAEPVLWRRLFCFRWGKKGRQQNQLSWKARYIERDLTELRVAAGGPAAHHQPADGMQAMFVQAHLAKRQQALPRAAVDDLMLVEDDEVAARVRAWRKSRGFDRGGGSFEVERPADLTQHVHARPDPGYRAGAAVGSTDTLAFSMGNICAGSGGGSSSSSRQRAPAQRRVAARLPGGGGGGGRAPAAAAAIPTASTAGSDTQQAAAGEGAAAGGSSRNNLCSSSCPPGSGASMTCGNCTIAADAAAAAVASMAAASAATAGVGAGGVGASGGGAGGGRRVRQRRRWTQIGNVFCDEMTGWVHVCDESCSEKVVEPCSGLLVCPISGQVSDRMITCAEEAEEEGQRGCVDDDTSRAAVDEDYGSERGRLARAFAAGYYCSNERELMRECGVRLSR